MGQEQKSGTMAQPSVSLMLLPHFDIFCDLLLNTQMHETWNLFVLHMEKKPF